MILPNRVSEQPVPTTAEGGCAQFLCLAFGTKMLGPGCARRVLRSREPYKPGKSAATSITRFGLQVCATCPAGDARVSLGVADMQPLAQDVGDMSNIKTHECARCGSGYRTSLALSNPTRAYCADCRTAAKALVQAGTVACALSWLRGDVTEAAQPAALRSEMQELEDKCDARMRDLEDELRASKEEVTLLKAQLAESGDPLIDHVEDLAMDDAQTAFNSTRARLLERLRLPEEAADPGAFARAAQRHCGPVATS